MLSRMKATHSSQDAITSGTENDPSLMEAIRPFWRAFISIITGLYGKIFSCVLDRNLLQNIKQRESLSDSVQCLIFVWNCWHSQSNLSCPFLRVQRLRKLVNDQYAAVELFKMDTFGSARRHHHSFRGTWQKLKVYHHGWQGVRRQESANRFPKRIHLWSSLQNISRASGREESWKGVSGILVGSGIGRGEWDFKEVEALSSVLRTPPYSGMSTSYYRHEILACLSPPCILQTSTSLPCSWLPPSLPRAVTSLSWATCTTLFWLTVEPGTFSHCWKRGGGKCHHWAERQSKDRNKKEPLPVTS